MKYRNAKLSPYKLQPPPWSTLLDADNTAHLTTRQFRNWTRNYPTKKYQSYICEKWHCCPRWRTSCCGITLISPDTRPLFGQRRTATPLQEQHREFFTSFFFQWGGTAVERRRGEEEEKEEEEEEGRGQMTKGPHHLGSRRRSDRSSSSCQRIV